jgi:hypothetical protein
LSSTLPSEIKMQRGKIKIVELPEAATDFSILLFAL